ncbi:unnamed protein product, partial [Mesorhabditis spiculigera]
MVESSDTMRIEDIPGTSETKALHLLPSAASSANQGLGIQQNKSINLYRKTFLLGDKRDDKLVSSRTPIYNPQKKLLLRPIYKMAGPGQWKVDRGKCPGDCKKELSICVIREHMAYGCPKTVKKVQLKSLNSDVRAGRNQRTTCPGPCGRQLSIGVVEEHISWGCPSHLADPVECPLCPEEIKTQIALLLHCTEQHNMETMALQEKTFDNWPAAEEFVSSGDMKEEEAVMILSVGGTASVKTYTCSYGLTMDSKKRCTAYYAARKQKDNRVCVRYCERHTHWEEPPAEPEPETTEPAGRPTYKKPPAPTKP